MSEWQALITHELQARGWTLGATQLDFESRVQDELRVRGIEPEMAQEIQVRRATVCCYARLLFDTCGENGTPYQPQAFQELWSYLYPRAMYRLHEAEAARDATQQALIKIFNKRTTCREPGSFLRWCELVLMREIADRFREQYGRGVTERGGKDPGARERGGEARAVLNEESDTGEETMSDPTQDTLRAALDGPMRDALRAVLGDCLPNERQTRVIWALFIEDLTFSQVARELGTTPLNVQVMRTRALPKLRDCAAMQRLFEDWHR